MGNGSTRGGGAASTTDGHSFAFGSTLEYLQAKVLGQKEMGAPSDPPLNRRTGVGRVDPKPGDYTDAFEKGNIVHLLGSENTGALAPGVIHLLHVLAKSAAGPQGHEFHPVRPRPRIAPVLLPAPPGRRLLRYRPCRCPYGPQPCSLPCRCPCSRRRSLSEQPP